MIVGISVSWRDIPEELIQRYSLERRVIVRTEGAEREVRFLTWERPPIIPAWRDGQLLLFTWGGGRSRLPREGWIEQENLGQWQQLLPQQVVIPALFGRVGAVWFQVPGGGVRGVLVHDERKQPCVYVLTEPATNYYKNMTRAQQMPVVLGEKI